jgi:hypothetical protein
VAAAAEDRGGGDDRAERQRLTGQVGGSGTDVLAEQERPEQAGRQRVQDGEPGLGGGQRPGGQGVRGQQHRGRPGDDEQVQRPAGEDGADAVVQVRAKFFDDRGHETPRDSGGRAQHGGPARARCARTATQADRHGYGQEHDAGGGQAGDQPEGAGRMRPPTRRRCHADEDADPGGHGGGGQPVAALDPPGTGHGQVPEHEHQLGGQNGLDQSQRAEVQGG